MQIFSPIQVVAFSHHCCGEAFSLMQSHLFLFLVLHLVSNPWIIAKTYVKELTTLLSSRSFMVSGIMLKSLSHFELNFGCGIRWSTVILLHMFHIPNTTDWKLYLLYSLSSFKKVNWPYTNGLISGLSSVPLIYVSAFMLIPYCFHDYSFCDIVWN